MNERTVATLKLSGGHVALDFTNTVDSRGTPWGPDVLRDYDDLLSWSRLTGVIPAGTEVVLVSDQDAALARAKALREAIYRIFAAPPAQEADLALLQREVAAAQQARMIVPIEGGYGWRWRPDDPDTIVQRIAVAAADLLTSTLVGRVRMCPGPNCGWLFLDTSRSGHRVWCSEDTCGTRNRVRRWRAKRRGAPV